MRSSIGTASRMAARPSGSTMMPRAVFARRPRFTRACVVVAHSTRALGVLTSGTDCIAYAPRTVASAMVNGWVIEKDSFMRRDSSAPTPCRNRRVFQMKANQVAYELDLDSARRSVVYSVHVRT